MTDYISREAFVEQKRKQYCEDCHRRKGMKNGKYKTLYEIGEAPCCACGIDDMLNDFEDFPAAEVREVVLCRDCKYYFKDDEGYEMCENSEGYDHVAEDGFCAWAKRKDGAEMRGETSDV